MALSEQYPTWEQIESIHKLYEERDWVNMVLAIFEYGYAVFFANYRIFLEESFGRRPYSDLIWDEVYSVYTNKPYCQLWQGLDIAEIPPTKYRRNKYEWFDSLRDGQVEVAPLKQGINLKDIFN